MPEQRQRLLQVLQGPGNATRVPFIASAPESGFIPRPDEYAALKRAILAEGREPIAITAALRGVGGFGKTELARYLCRDDEIEEAFDGGILWTTLGAARRFVPATAASGLYSARACRNVTAIAILKITRRTTILKTCRASRWLRGIAA